MRRNGQAPSTSIRTVRKICKKFPIAARQLKAHRIHRQNLRIHDEYDLQAFLHVLLLVSFDDIRPEEWVPSYAGGASRMDFLLKDEKIVIEAKYVRNGRTGKKILDELLVDIARYKAHPDCKTLVHFVYDPDSLIANPTGIKKELEEQSDSRLNVVALIVP
jgi:hypothetical protein